ncbi:MAG: chromosome segregation protein SMC [Methanobacteriota archaeon]|nr:MAG: chromosome segregation protein SMC [Euryarchaeota archaeon]
MFLKEIEMENFKSFANKVRVPFLTGFTAVTGPNGSGKSNIADAILFVLGPKSAKAIRAKRLTDLIWNGGKDKKASSHCEVSLFFDNSDRAIPIEADEVKLTRYVALSPAVQDGYNSYFYVNDRKATLDEFDSLLAHARISAEGYNLVQQGDIQRIVQMSDADRRRVLDNIAGITKFDDDIGQADSKRKQTEDNLGRIQIILDEIKKQIHQLSADREGALKYKELSGRLTLAKAQLVYKNREIIEQEINSTKEQLAKYETERAKLQKERSDLQNHLKAAEARLAELEAKIAERGGAEAKQLKEKLDGLRIERARATDGIATSTEEIRRLKTEITDGQKDRARVAKEIEAVQRERTSVEGSLGDLTKQLESAERDLRALDESASKTDSKVLVIQKEIIAMTKRVDESEEKTKAVVLEGDRANESLERLRNEVVQLADVLKTYQLELDDAEFQLKELRSGSKAATKNLAKLQEGFYAKRKEEQELSKQQGELQSAILELTRQYAGMKAEADVAENLKRGYSTAVAGILDARDSGKIKGIHGTIAQLGHLESKYETAILVAAGSRMQAIVVDDDAVAAACIDYLKKSRAGRATFLPLNKMLVGRPRGKAILVAKESVGFAIDLIRFDEKYRDAFFYVLGDTIVVETLDQARKYMGGVRLVTLGGELIEASGAMIGGDLEKTPLRFGAPDRREIDTVSEKLRRATEESERVTKRLAELRKEVVALETELKDVGGQTSSVDVKASALETKRREFTTKVNAIREDLEAKQKKLTETEKTAKRVDEDLARFRKDLDSLKAQRETRKGALLEAAPQAVSARMKELMANRTKAGDDVTAARAKLETLDAQTKVQVERRGEFDQRVDGLVAQKGDHEKRVKDFESSLQKLENEIRGLERMEANMSKEMQGLQGDRDAAYKEKTEVEGEIDKLGHKLETKEDFATNLQTELRAQEESLAKAIEELKSLGREIAGKLPPLDELKRTIGDCETQITALGPINMRALDDYDAQEKRFGELTDEFAKLGTQRQELINLVLELTERKKEGLGTVFTAINENFRRVYKEISEGGEAELLLENEKDPFTGGLIIRANPSHKKVLRLEALSGGEKSLVSMAFIFAIQEYDPSPFYLLDEIDQNLDAVNAERVARMIRRNSSTAQFVQISLRKITLKEADHIMGVTMTPAGHSDLVMRVNLSDIEDERATEAVVA